MNNKTKNNDLQPANPSVQKRIKGSKSPLGDLGVQHFKQAWQLIKQNKLFSIIYIAGTALGISMVMVLAILDYVKTADIAPESNRSRIMHMKSLSMTPIDTVRFKYNSSGRLSYKAVRLLCLELKTPEAVSVTTSGRGVTSLPNDDYLIDSQAKYVDTDYWRVFNFHFLAGKPFSDADFQSGLPVAVISQSLAKKFFGSADNAVGKEVEFGFKPVRVTGVVADVSYVLTDTYAQLWMPYTFLNDYDEYWEERGGMLGSFQAYLLARSSADFDAIRHEINEKVRLFNAQATDWKVDLLGQPDVQKVAINRFSSNRQPDMKKIRIQHVLIILLLLLVPAINLSGMNSTRMERRLGEMGVRKAFGASKWKLINQVLTENLLLTALGGLAGLLLSYLIIFITRNWIFDLGKIFIDTIPEGVSVGFSMSMLFNLKIFFIVLFACLVMNILSALVPVYRSLRKNITDSLYIKYD